MNWNGKADTIACLESLHGDSYINKQIVVVDNGSTDDSIDAIRSRAPGASVLGTGQNLGFSGGNNIGIEYAILRGADYILLLNNDTIVERNTLSTLISEAEAHRGVGLFTPMIHHFDRPDERWFAGSYIDLARGIATHVNDPLPAGDLEPRRIPWASGCCMLIRSHVMRKINGFDDRYFLNWEDVDLSLRVRALGLHIALVPRARIYHKVGRSFAMSGTGVYYYVRNNLLLVTIHTRGNVPLATRCVIARALGSTLRETKRDRKRGIQNLRFTLRAIRDHYCGRFGALDSPAQFSSNRPREPLNVGQTSHSDASKAAAVHSPSPDKL